MTDILIRGFVFQGPVAEDHGLDTDEHGSDGGFMRLPFRFGGTFPGSEKGETDCDK